MTSFANEIVGPVGRLRTIAVIGGIILLAGLALSLRPLPDGITVPLVDTNRVWSSLFVASFYLVTLGLGGTLFIAFGYVAGASWNVAFRRVPEAMAATLPVTGLALFAILAVRMQEYGWPREGEHAGGTFWFKDLWADPPFWIARAAVYVGLWVILSRAINATSRQQDAMGDIRLTHRNRRLSLLFLAVYAVTFTLASCDWLMLLEPMWFSTIWGVYSFAGMIQATVAAIVILCILLSRPGRPLQQVFTEEHLHDLGKLLLGFSCFWMYIWFSQYMLIWYSNIPEETSYFTTRTHGVWGPVMILDIVLNWIVPFFLLLPKPCKRSRGVMMKVAVVVLVGRAVDLYLAVFPSLTEAPPIFPIWEIAAAMLVVGLFGYLFHRSLTTVTAVPVGDPLLGESLHYHA